jgi:hypothetical protein
MTISKLILLALFICLPTFASAVDVQPTAVGSYDGCVIRVMCVAGTSASGACTDAAGSNIVLRNAPSGNHVAYIIPDTTGRTCTINVKEGYGGHTADFSSQVGQMTCGSALSISLTGPAESVWFESASTITGSITGILVTCSNR